MNELGDCVERAARRRHAVSTVLQTTTDRHTLDGLPGEKQEDRAFGFRLRKRKARFCFSLLGHGSLCHTLSATGTCAQSAQCGTQEAHAVRRLTSRFFAKTSGYQKMEYESEDDFIDFLADECEKADKAVKKVRNCLRAIKAQRTRAVEEQLNTSEIKATDLVQDTLALIKGATKRPALQNIAENEEFLEIKAGFKKTVRALNMCMQDIQALSTQMSYDTSAGGADDVQEEAGPVDSGDLELEMVFNSEQVDVDKEIEMENQQDAMKLAQDTLVLRDMMKDTVDMIEEQGEQLNEVDEVVETAAETTESAVKELEAARGHQKATQKLKIIIGSICGCLVLTAIIILSVMFGSPAGSTPISMATTTTTTTAAPGGGGGGGVASRRLFLRSSLDMVRSAVEDSAFFDA